MKHWLYWVLGIGGLFWMMQAILSGSDIIFIKGLLATYVSLEWCKESSCKEK